MSTSAAEEACTETVTETFRPAQSCVLETWNVAHPGNEGSEQAKNSAVGLAGVAAQDTGLPVLAVVARPAASIVTAKNDAFCMVVSV